MEQGSAGTSTPSSSPDARPETLGWTWTVGLLLLQFVSRYLPSPWAVFVADDWTNWLRSSSYASYADALRFAAKDPNRPLSMMAVEAGFRLLNDNAFAWTSLSILANSALLMFFVWMVLELTGRRVAAVAAGSLLALFPILTETFHWSTQVLNEVACALVFYAMSGWLWAKHVRTGARRHVALSAIGYGIGLFSYEAGIFLPAAYVCLLPWQRQPAKALCRMLPFAFMGALYLSWRLADAWGLNAGVVYPPHMQAGLSLWTISWNARQIAHWWLGDHMAGSVLEGLKSLGTLHPWLRRGLALGNAVLLLGWGIALLRSQEGRASRDTAMLQGTGRVLGFALVWTMAALVVSLVSYTAPRLNVLPAMGIGLFLAVLLARTPVRSWGPWLFVPALLAMLANQGTSESYRQAGVLTRRLHAHLEATAATWMSKDVLLIDTTGLRHRLTPGLLAPITEDESTWVYYGNAILMRGFVPKGMVGLVAGGRPVTTKVIHDVEYGARRVDDRLQYHDRFRPAHAHTTPMDQVFRVDLWQIGSGQSRPLCE